MTCTGAVASTRRDARRRSSPRSPRRGSPSAARRAPTTASPRPRWRTASARATSRWPAPATNGSAARAPRPPSCVRFATAGSVDDGKSTLIGRLLYDSKQIFEDQLEHVERDLAASAATATSNLALLTDGLRAEREQGITIDVAYRYFATPRRKFIIADTPGPRAVHAQHGHRRLDGRPRDRPGRRAQRRASSSRAATRSSPRCCASRTSSCASTRWTSSTATRRSSTAIVADFADWAAKLDVHDITFIPISALHGDNVVDRSERMPWYEGPSLLYHLEHVHIASDRNLHRRALPGAVGDPADVRRAPRLPRLRRPGRRRRAARRRRGRGAALRAHDADRRDRHLRRPARGGLPADVGDAAARGRRRRLARRHDLPRRTTSPTRAARARGDGLLDGRRAARARRPLRDQAHDAHRARARSTSCATASTSTRCTATRTPTGSG